MRLFFLTTLLFIVGATFALSQTFPLTTYTVNDGLLQSTIYCVYQDSKGFLWVGTQDGVSKFDGVEFTHYTTDNGLVNNRVLSIAEDHKGRIWFGTAGGASRLHGGELVAVTTDPVFSLLADDSLLWIGTAVGLKLYSNDSLTSPPSTRDLKKVYSLYTDRAGALWCGLDSGVAVLQNGTLKGYSAPEGLPLKSIKSIIENVDGTIILGSEGAGAFILVENRFTQLAGTDSLQIYALCRDSKGRIWIGTFGDGVVRISDEGIARYSTENGFPERVVRSIIEDREGNMWFGTYGGIVRMDNRDILTYTTMHGLAHNVVMAIAEDAQGAMWFGTYGGGASVLHNGVFRTFSDTNGLPSNSVRALLRDSQDAMWLGTHDGLVRFSDGQFTVMRRREGLSSSIILSLLEDRSGNLWIGTFDGGVNRFANGAVHSFTTDDGLVGNRVRAITEDSSGALWFGTDDGVSTFDGTTFTNFTQKNGFVPNSVRAMASLHDGSVLFATDGGGVGKFHDRTFTFLTKRDGLSNDVCYFALHDDESNLWIGTNKGINRYDGQQFRVYTVHDGLPSNETNSNAAFKDSRGMLWFGTVNGVVRWSPHVYEENSVPPPIYVARFRVLDRDTNVYAGLQLEHDQNRLEFAFTGICLTAPQQVVYRYMLEGIEKTWLTTTQRSVLYTTVPAGEYTFKVQARNNSGVWSTKPAEIRFTILSPFWSTWWFRTFSVCFVVVLGVLLYRKRLQTLNKEKRIQEQMSNRLIELQESERKRIAAGLHDSLGQNLLVLKNALQHSFAGQNIDPEFQKELTSLADLAQQSLNEVREISFDLHPHVLDRLGLRKAIETIVDKIRQTSSVVITAEFHRMPDRIPSQLEINIYRVAQEALSNIVKHSAATAARIRLASADGALQLQMSDNGKGFDVQSFLSRPPDQWSLGLLNIAERVRLLQGTYTISSTPGSGTSLTVQVPLHTDAHV